MNIDRKSFLGSIVAAFTGLAFTNRKQKLVEKFELEVEDIGNGRFRANIKTGGVISMRTCSVESPAFSPDQDPVAWSKAARAKFIMDTMRAVAIHIFPDDQRIWPEWNKHGYGFDDNEKAVSIKWPPSTISDSLDPDWHHKYTEYMNNKEWQRESIAKRFVQFIKGFRSPTDNRS